MTFKLKLHEYPAWVESLTNLEYSNMMSEVYLKGGSGSQVSVPAILLVAVSPLARDILTTDQAPQYHTPVITVPSISGEALQKMVDILVTGEGSVSVQWFGEIQDVFKTFGIEGGLICSQPQSRCADMTTGKDMEMDNYHIYDKTEDIDFNKNFALLKSMDHLKEESVETKNLEVIVKIEASNLPDHKTENSENQEPNDDTQVFKLNNRSICGICHKDFKDLFHHVKTVHERTGRKEKIPCPDCKKYISYHNFSRHIRESHQQIKTPCPVCGKYLTGSNIYTHIRSVHEKIKIECDICGKKFDRDYLKAHKKTVHKFVTR